MERQPLEGVGQRLEGAIETLETLERSLEPSVPVKVGRADVEFVGIYFHHLWQVTTGVLAVEQVRPEQRASFRTIFGEHIDLGELRRLRSSGDFELAVAAFVDFIRWIIIFEGSLVANDTQASRVQGMSLELVDVFEDLVRTLFLDASDDISWRTHRFATALEALRGVLAMRWGDELSLREP